MQMVRQVDMLKIIGVYAKYTLKFKIPHDRDKK
jgi:hypothetical protein